MFGWLSNHLWPLTRQTVKNWSDDDAMTLAAAVSYYAGFSFFPLTAVLLASLGLVVHLSSKAELSQKAIIKIIETNTSPELADQLAPVITSVEQQAGIGGPVALLTLLIGAIGVFSQIDASFDRIWKVPSPEGHGILRTIGRVLFYRLKAFLMLLALGALVLVSFGVGMALTALSQFTDNWGGEMGNAFVQHAAIVSVNALLFTLMFKTLPRAEVAWRDAVRGGLFVALVWEAGRQLLSLFVIGNEKFSAYGLIGAFIAIMAWIYYASLVLFLGAELVHTLAERRKQRHTSLPM